MRLTLALLLALLSVSALAQPVRIATWNIERFMSRYDQLLLPERARDRQEQWDDEEDLYEIARTIELPQFEADIIGLQEAGTQQTLEMFNRDWLDGRFAFVHAFPSNSPGQHVAILARPGYEALDIRDYHGETDPVKDMDLRYDKEDYGGIDKNPLFPRGPGFVKFRTPGGQVIWVGSTHVKSKGGNDRAATLWRIREMERTRQIVQELAAEPGVDGVVMLGDFNDDFGQDRYEQQVGRDAIEVMLEGDPGLVSPTRELELANPDLATFHSELKPRRWRSFIDHIFVTPGLGGKVRETTVIDAPIAAVASDHYPVMVTLELD